MLIYSLLASALIGISVAILGIGREQAVGVQGTLMCNNVPASNVKVKLYDNNIGLDTFLDEGNTDAQGNFQLQGNTREISTMDPKLDIYNYDCDNPLPCDLKITVYIPDSYITDGSSSPSQYYNAGTVQLAGRWKGESRDCLNK